MRAGRAVEQLGADMVLQERDRPADRRRRSPQAPPRPGEAALVHGRHEHLHRVDAIHLLFRLGEH